MATAFGRILIALALQTAAIVSTLGDIIVDLKSSHSQSLHVLSKYLHLDKSLTFIHQSILLNTQKSQNTKDKSKTARFFSPRFHPKIDHFPTCFHHSTFDFHTLNSKDSEASRTIEHTYYPKCALALSALQGFLPHVQICEEASSPGEGIIMGEYHV